jgi:hypothetical protein
MTVLHRTTADWRSCSGRPEQRSGHIPATGLLGESVTRLERAAGNRKLRGGAGTDCSRREIKSRARLDAAKLGTPQYRYSIPDDPREQTGRG